MIIKIYSRIGIRWENYVSGYSRVALWMTSVFFGFAILFLFYSAIFVRSGILGSDTFSQGVYGTAAIRSLWYAASTATMQVVFGLILGAAIFILGNKFLTVVVLSLSFTIYSLQPSVVFDIWTRLLGFESNFSSLIWASTWQYTSFCVMFFFLQFSTVERKELALARSEVSTIHAYRAVYQSRLIIAFCALLLLRFILMLAKFDLPFVFLKGHDSSYRTITFWMSHGRLAEIPKWIGMQALVMMTGVALFFAIKASVPKLIIIGSSEKRSKIKKSRESQIFPAVRAVVKVNLFLLLGCFLTPIIVSLFGIVGQSGSSTLGMFSTYGSVISYSVLVSGCSAAIAVSVASIFHHFSIRGVPGTDIYWSWLSVLVYATPMIALNLSANKISDFLESCFQLSGVYLTTGQSVSSLITSILFYTIWLTPFILFLTNRTISEIPRDILKTEVLSIVDGLKPASFRILWNSLFRSRQLMMFFLVIGFIIIWQDLSLSLRLENFEMFSYTLYDSQSLEDVNYTAPLSASLLVSLVVGAVGGPLIIKMSKSR